MYRCLSLTENGALTPYRPQGEMSQATITHYNIKEMLLPGCKEMVKPKIFGWKYSVILKGLTLNSGLEANGFFMDFTA